MITNALTIDVEDYFQVSVFSSYISKDSWDLMECRIEQNIDRILDILASQKITATFFILGWIAKRYPQVVRKIAEQDHEIASHGYGHDKIKILTPDQFLIDVKTAKFILEDIAGVEIKGYRAPSFSIDIKNLWAFDILKSVGYIYSSSIYPIQHDHYGMPESPRFAHQLSSGIIEIPISTARFFGKNFPASGGGYFRLMPYFLSRWLFTQVIEKDCQPLVFYFHPWEIDTDQPRLQKINIKAKFRHYVNIDAMEKRLIRLLNEFKWDRMDRVFLELPVMDSIKKMETAV